MFNTHKDVFKCNVFVKKLVLDRKIVLSLYFRKVKIKIPKKKGKHIIH